MLEDGPVIFHETVADRSPPPVVLYPVTPGHLLRVEIARAFYGWNFSHNLVENPKYYDYLEEMEQKIDELIEERNSYRNAFDALKEKIQEEHDIAAYNNILPVMDALRRLVYFIEGTEAELVD